MDYRPFILILFCYTIIVSSQINNIYDFQSNDSRFIVFSSHQYGFYERLKALADWYVFAVQSKRRLLLDWRYSHDCQIHFRDVFQELVGLDYIFLNSTTDVDMAWYFENISQQQNFSFTRITPMVDWFDESVLMSSTNYLYTNLDKLTSDTAASCFLSVDSREFFYKSLLPKSSRVTEFVNSIKLEYHQR